MKVFIAGFCHESCSFSPIPTSRRAFEEFDYYRPESDPGYKRAETLNGYGAFLRRTRREGDDPVLSTYTFAQPSAPMAQADYEALRDEILADLKQAGPVDAVLFFLHGSQMAQGYDDCEGDLLQRARDIVGAGAFVGALLDLHTNMSPQMLSAADALVACREYPHTDFAQRADHLYDIAQASAAGTVHPVQHFLPLPMLGMYYTTEPCMIAANAAAWAVQKDEDILSVSLVHAFPWTDNPYVGAGVLIVARDGDVETLTRAKRVAEAFVAARTETRAMRVAVDVALDRAEQSASDGKPLIIADAADNAGGGAPSDATFILARILERQLTGYALGIFWDPVAVGMAKDAGEGAQFMLRLGGKCGIVSGTPLDVAAKVRALRQSMNQTGIGYTHPIGDAALLEIDGNLVVISTVRGQVFSPSCFTDLGVDLAAMNAVVVKSSQHFYEQFAPLGRGVVYCETPGLLTLDFKPDMYQRIPRPTWPFDDVEPV